jgi:hypothetical protein
MGISDYYSMLFLTETPSKASLNDSKKIFTAEFYGMKKDLLPDLYSRHSQNMLQVFVRGCFFRLFLA